MANAPKLRGIPFNQRTSSDWNSFAPVYDPVAIRYARRVNFAIGTAVAVLAGTAILFLFLGPLAGPSAAASEARRSGDPGSFLPAVFLEMMLPIFLATIGFFLVLRIPSRIGFDLSRAYEATASALREWLSATEAPTTESKDELSDAAKLIAQGKQEPITIITRDLQIASLQPTADGGYRLSGSSLT